MPSLLGYLRRPGLVAALAAWVLVVSPLLVWGVTRAVGLDGPMGTAMVLASAGCAATSGPAFARIVGLDAEIALVVAVLTTALVPFTAPPLALWLLGLDLAISAGGLSLRLLLVVGVPGVLAVLLARALGQERLRRAAPLVDGLLVLTLVAFALGIMAGVQARLWAEPGWVLAGLGLGLALTLGLNGAAALAFAATGQRLALSAGLISAFRNTALFIAVLPPGAPGSVTERVVLFCVLGQIPMFLGPVMLRPVYGWVVGRDR
jgi:BASS family bile acid:Na+ symporter